MSEHSFLKIIKDNGRYGSQGEANRAAHAVFGTIKAWLPPSASDELRKALPKDASRLWRFAPVDHGVDGQKFQSDQFIFRVQQLGRYCSFNEAKRATCSVFGAIARSLAAEPGSFLAKLFPADVMVACRAHSAWAA